MFSREYFSKIDTEIKAYYLGYFYNLPSSKSYKKYWHFVTKEEKLKYPDFIPIELSRHFVRGYVEMNGRISTWNYKGKYGRKITILGNKTFLLGLGQRIMDASGITFRLSEGKACIHSSSTQGLFKFCSWLYTDCLLLNEKFYEQIIEFKKYRESLGDEIYWNKIPPEIEYKIRPLFDTIMIAGEGMVYKEYKKKLDNLDNEREMMFYMQPEHALRYKKYIKPKPMVECPENYFSLGRHV